MTTEDVIIHIFLEVDEQMPEIAKHPCMLVVGQGKAEKHPEPRARTRDWPALPTTRTPNKHPDLKGRISKIVSG